MVVSGRCCSILFNVLASNLGKIVFHHFYKANITSTDVHLALYVRILQYVDGGVPHGEDRVSCFPECCTEANVQFYPMVYGIPGSGHHANTSFPDVPPEYSTILGFNEPNQHEQETYC